MDILMEENLPTYEKCGEIMTSYHTEKRLYALKCMFCEKRFSTLLEFVDHIEDIHISIIKKEVEHSELISIQPKEEFLDISYNASQVSLDPLTNTELSTINKKDNEKDLTENEDIAEEKTDNESSDVDFECENDSEATEESDTDDDIKTSNSLLDEEIDTNKGVTSALIEGYANLPVLWKKFNRQPETQKKREEALQKLTKDLNKQFKKRMKWPSINERIKKLRKRFRNELIEEKATRSKGEDFKPTWYFPKLDFLRETIKLTEKKQNKTTATIAEVSFKDEQHVDFIKIYESFRCLWHIEDVGFKSKAQRLSAIKEMKAKVEEKLQVQLSEDDVQRKIQRLKTACTKEKHEMLNCERLGTTHQPTFKYFSNISFLVDHVCPFKCPFCAKTFKGREIFRVHKSQHDGTSPFTCSICKKSYSSPGNLAIHLRRHNRDYTFECKPCARKFATTDEYNIHMRQHTGEKPYFCEVCGKSFATCSLFGRHKRRHENRPTHWCTICNRGFYEQIRYKEHMNIHNNVRDRVCDVCGKGFTHLKYLKQHKLIHSGRRDYVCTICGKDFAQSAGLYWHMKTHGAKVTDKSQNDEKTKKKVSVKSENTS